MTSASAQQIQVTSDNADSETQSVPSLISGFVFFTVVITLLIYAGFWIKSYLEDEQQLPVQTIVFSGERSVLQDDILERLIRSEEKGSFFELDVNQVHQLLEHESWVYRASVRKRWPSSLHIYLVEQQPVVQWNNDLLLNQYGDSFNGIKQVNNLPRLFGPGGSERTALAGYKAMQLLLESSNLSVKSLVLSERFAWQLELHNGIKLNLGRQEFIDRLQRFIDVYPLLLKQDKKIEYVDLRYETGLAVGWLMSNPIESE